MGAKNGSGWPRRSWAMYQAKPAATDACVIAHNTSRRRRTATWPPSIVLLSSEILVTLLTPAQAVLLANRLAASAVGSGVPRAACLSRRDHRSGVPGRQSFGRLPRLG